MPGRKPIVLWGLILAASLTVAGAAGAAERCVLAEFFTSYV